MLQIFRRLRQAKERLLLIRKKGLKSFLHLRRVQPTLFLTKESSKLFCACGGPNRQLQLQIGMFVCCTCAEKIWYKIRDPPRKKMLWWTQSQKHFRYENDPNLTPIVMGLREKYLIFRWGDVCVCILKVIKFFSNSCSLGKLLLLKAAAHFVPDTSENSDNFSLYSYRLLNGASNLVKIANFAFFSEFFFKQNLQMPLALVKWKIWPWDQNK